MLWLLKEDFAENFLPRYASADNSFFDFFKFSTSLHGLPKFSSSIKIIPVQGVLTVSDEFVGTTYSSILKDLLSAEHDFSIKEIVLAINSPGGSVDGSTPVFDAISSFSKPITAVVMDSAASAAFILATQAKKILMLNNMSSVGSLGVVSTVVDSTEFLDKRGIKVLTFTNSQSPYKRYDVKTEEGSKIIQEKLDEIYLNVEERISKARNISTEFIRSNFGKGKMLFSVDAIEKKMVDGFLNESNENLKTMEMITMADVYKEPHTVSDLTAMFPVLCNKMVDDASIKAVDSERKRVKQWASFIDVDAKLVAQGINSSDELDIATASILAAKRNGFNMAQSMAEDNPAHVDIDRKSSSNDFQSQIKDKKAELSKYL